MTRRGPLILVAVLAAALCWAGARAAEGGKVAKVKAAYLLKFTQFARWPEKAFDEEDQRLVIGVVGRDALRPILERTVAGHRHDGHRIAVRRFALPRREGFDSKEQYRRAVAELGRRLRRCHAVYFARQVTEPPVRRYLTALRSEPILLMGDRRAYAERGAMLALHIERGRVLFYAHLGAIDVSPVAVSSKLLRLARVIESEQ